ncbi:hypothetical protein [Merdimmobilis hominis]|jgi:hypothetical protein|uniref:Uncharacterized protein n=1 Tax=uncultured Anaerotruncus sp. TaxID=905011 RepID=A0A6N2SPR1_9FIRM|nr:hypothetical protein [Merdimmobilis hominis]MCD4836146.1 hypothetical protein [Merdimmobilis hominis]
MMHIGVPPLPAAATGDVMGQGVVVILTAFLLLGAVLIAYFVWIARKGKKK